MYFNCTISSFISFNISLSDALAVMLLWNPNWNKDVIDWLIDWSAFPIAYKSRRLFRETRAEIGVSSFRLHSLQKSRKITEFFFENEKSLSQGAWKKNSRYFTTPWRNNATEQWLQKFPQTDDVHYLDLGSDVIRMEFLQMLRRRHFAGKPVVALSNVVCFLGYFFRLVVKHLN